MKNRSFTEFLGVPPSHIYSSSSESFVSYAKIEEG